MTKQSQQTSTKVDRSNETPAERKARRKAYATKRLKFTMPANVVASIALAAKKFAPLGLTVADARKLVADKVAEYAATLDAVQLYVGDLDAKIADAKAKATAMAQMVQTLEAERKGK